MTINAPLALIILDGWGLGDKGEGNAISRARTPNMDNFYRRYPWTKLRASGEAVGLPRGQMGNSEVGHLNIGAGRIVYQELTRISKSIDDGSFYENAVLSEAFALARSRGAAVHLTGLLSDGGVHSHMEHLLALLQMGRRFKVDRLFMHLFLDGRDVPPSSAATYLQQLEAQLAGGLPGTISSMMGRYWGMDRDRRWERVDKAYRAMVYGPGRRAGDPRQALDDAYRRGETDEFVEPVVFVDDNGDPRGTVGGADIVIAFNFRPDRMRQLTRAFTERGFAAFDRGPAPVFPHWVCFTEYLSDLRMPVAFPTPHLSNTLGEVLAAHGIPQLRLAETEKYAHVTFFFNGGREEPFPLEERLLIPSPAVATYDRRPEMSAVAIGAACRELRRAPGRFFVVNFANADMLGHTGQMAPVIKGIETVDRCLGLMVAEVLAHQGAAIITADHGNAETMLDPDGCGAHTAHTTSPVPLILVSRPPRALRSGGILADIAPTVLALLGIQQPPEMSGSSLLR